MNTFVEVRSNDLCPVCDRQRQEGGHDHGEVEIQLAKEHLAADLDEELYRVRQAYHRAVLWLTGQSIRTAVKASIGTRHLGTAVIFGGHPDGHGRKTARGWVDFPETMRDLVGNKYKPEGRMDMDGRILLRPTTTGRRQIRLYRNTPRFWFATGSRDQGLYGDTRVHVYLQNDGTIVLSKVVRA